MRDLINSEYVVALEHDPQPNDMQILAQGLTDYNASHAAGEVPDYLLATVRDKDGQLAGGLLGATYLGWLTVQVVWLPDTLRGQGLGRALMDLAEAEALRRGIKSVFLETLNFQALSFYEKCGYKIFSELRDFPPGGARYALTKNLQEPTQAAP
jgi:GNAT superfamily N-acetyltransferase